MKLIAATIMSLFMLASNVTDGRATSASGTSQTAPVQNSQTIKITRSGSQQPGKGPAEYFTGSVSIDPLFSENPPAHVSGGGVTFDAGARTAWHRHPL